MKQIISEGKRKLNLDKDNSVKPTGPGGAHCSSTSFLFRLKCGLGRQCPNKIFWFAPTLIFFRHIIFSVIRAMLYLAEQLNGKGWDASLGWATARWRCRLAPVLSPLQTPLKLQKMQRSPNWKCLRRKYRREAADCGWRWRSRDGGRRSVIGTSISVSTTSRASSLSSSPSVSS